MYQKIESAIYDDAPELVTLWRFFSRYKDDRLRIFQKMARLEYDGLTGDCHPRKVFDRSPFGIVALVLGTLTIWMTVLRNYAGENFGWIEPIKFNWFAGTMWVVGLFLVLWYILKTIRNNKQAAVLASVNRALELYLDLR